MFQTEEDKRRSRLHSLSFIKQMRLLSDLLGHFTKMAKTNLYILSI